MKLVKDKLLLPKLLRDILNVIYWFVIIFLGFILLFIFWAYISGNTKAGNVFLFLQYSIPVALNFDVVGKLTMGNSLYEVSISKWQGALIIKEAPFALFIFTFSIVFISSFVLLYVINLLRKVLKNISLGNQFNSKNGIYVRNIGLIIIIGSIFRAIVDVAFRLYLSSNLSSDNFKILTVVNFSSFFTVLFFGFVILVISQIFKIGYEIKEEQDLTI